MLFCIPAFLIGICLALFLPIVIPAEFMPMFGVFVLITLLFTAGAVNAKLWKKLNVKIFISGFICAVIAVFGAVCIGDKLDLDIYPACVLLLLAATFKCCYDIFRFYVGNKNNG